MNEEVMLTRIRKYKFQFNEFTISLVSRIRRALSNSHALTNKPSISSVQGMKQKKARITDALKQNKQLRRNS